MHYIITEHISRWNEITLKKYIKTILSPKGTFKHLQFFIYQKLLKKRYQNDHNFLPFKITSKYARPSYISFPSKLQQKIHRNNVDFSSIESSQKKYIKTTSTFRSSKLHRRKYVETTSIFFPSKFEKVCRNDEEIYGCFFFDVSR